VLPGNFPGIRFNDKGVCNFCLDFTGSESLLARKADYARRFDSLLERHRGKSSYDVLMCYSGGKDSTYTLSIFKERYGLHILALTFDNGFLPQGALENIQKVVGKLGVDHIIFKPRFDLLSRIFRHCASQDVYPPKALERASAICSSCMGIMKYFALRTALEKDIPFIGFGWSPGQAPISSSIMRNMPMMIKEMQKTIYDPLFKIAGEEIKPYFLEEKHFSGAYNFPHNVNPMAFLDYDIDRIYENISRFGWKRPEGVDANSTNCQINTLGNSIHKQRLGFHPYAFELANLVREGYMDRDTALERLSEREDRRVLAEIKDKLGISD
jgi:tRNA(Ile)-lysidine synthase TilS/MesJ